MGSRMPVTKRLTAYQRGSSRLCGFSTAHPETFPVIPAVPIGSQPDLDFVSARAKQPREQLSISERQADAPTKAKPSPRRVFFFTARAAISQRLGRIFPIGDYTTLTKPSVTPCPYKM
jgi:hypothetical protein